MIYSKIKKMVVAAEKAAEKDEVKYDANNSVLIPFKSRRTGNFLSGGGAGTGT